MELSVAVDRLAALAQDARLRVFRMLVRAGADGLPAGVIADELGMPPQTLSFHLKHLANAGLIEGRRTGRQLIYSIRVGAMRDLLAFLSEDCCQGRRELCVPVGKPVRSRLTELAKDPARPTVLFLCSHNSVRSQMAEALLKKRAGDRFAVFSAGLQPGPVDPMTLQVLAEVGIDASQCRPSDLGDFVGKRAIDHAIVVCERAQRDCPTIHPFALAQHYWPFEDPAEVVGTDKERLQKFREVRDAIDRRIRAWLAEQGATGTRRGPRTRKPTRKPASRR